MRKVFQPLIILIIIIFSISCGKPKTLEYRDIRNFNIETLSMGGSVISADVMFYNPNNFQLRLKRAEMNISVNNKYIGKSTLDTMMIIPKRDSFLIPVHLTVDVKTLISNSLGSLFSNEIDLKMNGTARLGKGIFFFNFPFTYQGKQKFKLF